MRLRCWLRLVVVRLRYRVHGHRYGHTPLTDIENVRFDIVDE